MKDRTAFHADYGPVVFGIRCRDLRPSRFGFDANIEIFRTAWFVESIVTQILVIFIIRTARPFWRVGRILPSPEHRLARSPIALALSLAVGSHFGFGLRRSRHRCRLPRYFSVKGKSRAMENLLYLGRCRSLKASQHIEAALA